MTGRVEDLTRDAQLTELSKMADTLVETVKDSGPMTTRDALNAGVSKLGVVESEVKLGLSYAKAVGRIELNTNTWMLQASSGS